MASLNGQKVRIETQVERALSLLNSIPGIRGTSRHYLAEIALIRVYALFESVLEEAACRLVSGADYLDGSSPNLLRPQPTRGFERARRAMRTFGRSSPRIPLRWNKPSEVRDNLSELFPPTEHFVVHFQQHGKTISHIRKTRNHIAHANVGTRLRFQEVVEDLYGAKVPTITPGRLLLSPRFFPTTAERWCKELRIIMKGAIRA